MTFVFLDSIRPICRFRVVHGIGKWLIDPQEISGGTRKSGLAPAVSAREKRRGKMAQVDFLMFDLGRPRGLTSRHRRASASICRPNRSLRQGFCCCVCRRIDNAPIASRSYKKTVERWFQLPKLRSTPSIVTGDRNLGGFSITESKNGVFKDLDRSVHRKKCGRALRSKKSGNRIERPHGVARLARTLFSFALVIDWSRRPDLAATGGFATGRDCTARRTFIRTFNSETTDKES